MPEPTTVTGKTLRGWSVDQVAALLRARPDLAIPPPRDLDELARQAASHRSIVRAVHDLPTQSRLVLEALALLDEPPVELLIELSDPPPGREQVEQALADLRARLLLGPTTLRVSGEVAPTLSAPARLGESLADLLPGLNAHTLHQVAAGLGLPPSRTKAAALDAVLSAFGSPTASARVLAALPEPLRARLRALDEQGPVVRVPGLDPARGSWPDDPALLQLVDLTLVVLRGGPYVEVPREVAVGLRHPHPLRLAVPLPEPGPPADPTLVAAHAAAAASDALALLDAVADELDRAPLPLLSTGGIGVRELRRLGPPAEVATLLELAESLGLVATASKDLRLTKRWDTWRAQPDAQRWADLARGWTRLAVLPAPRSGRQVPALKSYPSIEVAEVRPRLLEVLRTHGGVRISAAHYAQRWFREPLEPYGFLRLEVADVLEDLLAEAGLFGLAVDGVPSPLVACTPEALTALAEVGEHRVRAQADGTLVCAGAPCQALRRDLDALATVESRGAATVWRLSEPSLAKAYAAGWTAAQAQEALERWAGELPQALRYLVGDAARRAGRLRTGEASSYLVAQDEAALADALAALRSLKLTRISPTVAVSAAAPTALDDALAKAGLAAGSVRAAARAKGKRAVGREPVAAPPEPDVDALARRLR